MAAALAPLLLGPEPAAGRRGLVGAAAGVLTLTVLLVALVARFDLVQALTLYGFRLDLPPLASPGAVTRPAPFKTPAATKSNVPQWGLVTADLACNTAARAMAETRMAARSLE